MSGKNQHVVPHEGDWAVKGAGNGKATVVVPTQQEAINIGRQISQNQHSELFIHNRQGQIRERDSHGHDPRNIKGTSTNPNLRQAIAGKREFEKMEESFC